MGVPQSIIGKLLDECEVGIATEGCILVSRETLKAILQELVSLRRTVTSKSPSLDPKVEERIKYIEKWCESIDKSMTALAHQVANIASKVGELELGGGVVYGMQGGGS